MQVCAWGMHVKRTATKDDWKLLFFVLAWMPWLLAPLFQRANKLCRNTV